ncbi:MAG: SHOCT domain-containing protein [Flavobacteriales bacterium]|nr:SHOCT domain-containing protein [Flavobacteriales bacterium]
MEQIRHSHDRQVNTVLVISKKHWVTYVIPVILLIIGALSILSKNFIGGIIFLTLGIITVLANKSVSMVLTNEDLVFKSGFLPWNKTYYEIPLEDIYESYFEKGIFATIFGFASITIRRTEGTTSSFSSSGMTEAKELTGSINSLIRKIKKNTKQSFVNVNANISIADEIHKLVELKEKGILSAEEFDLHKQRLLNYHGS